MPSPRRPPRAALAGGHRLDLAGLNGGTLEILKTREVEFTGAFRIVMPFEDLNHGMQAELEGLRLLVAELQAVPQEPRRVGEVSDAVAASLEAVERNVSRESARLRLEAVPTSAAAPELAPSAGPREQPREMERLGCE